jgi:hypothetical protein
MAVTLETRRRSGATEANDGGDSGDRNCTYMLRINPVVKLLASRPHCFCVLSIYEFGL